MSEKNSKRHPVAGDPGWEPKVEAPKVAKEARHGNPDARPEGSGGPNQPKSTSRETVSPAPARGPSKTRIPSSGRVEAQLGHGYPRVKPGDLVVHEDSGAHKRAVTPQIKQHPVAVPKSMRNKKS